MQAEAAANGVGPAVERLERDAEGLTDDQRRAAVMADAPELAALLSELQGSLAEVRSHVGPVLNEVCVILSHLCVAVHASPQLPG